MNASFNAKRLLAKVWVEQRNIDQNKFEQTQAYVYLDSHGDRMRERWIAVIKGFHFKVKHI